MQKSTFPASRFVYQNPLNEDSRPRHSALLVELKSAGIMEIHMRYALILAGGSGTRLWPLSNESLPKQLAPLGDGRSLLEVAYSRLEGAVPEERRFVCGSARFRDATLALLPGLSRTSAAGLDRYIGEPQGRDTLAAVALSCALIAGEDPEAVVAILTSDHVIRPEDSFRDLLSRAFSLVEARPELLATFGVEPDRPATGYGYLELGGELEPSGVARRVSSFREKPDARTAEAFLAAGPERYLWNSGMFVWRASRFLELARRYEEELAEAVSRIASAAAAPAALREAMAAGYPSLKRISVDYGVMERASRDPDVTIAAIPLDVEWRDIGSWIAYGGLLGKDGAGNESSGEALLVESSGNIAVSTEGGHLVACLGCEDLVVVHTPKATLVCPKSRADDLKKLYAAAAELKGGEYR
jgi:mannose-1-phosphate guanylyltransferase